jgi:hypothetical protein
MKSNPETTYCLQQNSIIIHILESTNERLETLCGEKKGAKFDVPLRYDMQKVHGYSMTLVMHAIHRHTTLTTPLSRR